MDWWLKIKKSADAVDPVEPLPTPVYGSPARVIISTKSYCFGTTLIYYKNGSHFKRGIKSLCIVTSSTFFSLLW